MKSIRRFWSIAIPFCTANLLALSLQHMSLKPYQKNLFNWITEHKLLYVLTACILFFIILGLDALVNNMYFANAFAATVIAALGFSQYYKLQILGEPVYPWDLNQLKNFSEMLHISRNIASPALVIAMIFLIAAMLAATFWLPRTKKKLPYRMTAILTAGFVIVFCVNLQSPVFAKPLKKIGAVNYNWNQKENYLANGFMIAFLQNIGSKIQSQPADYHEDEINRIVEAYAADYKVTEESANEKPNIVLVMNESLFDPTRLPNISFSEDPMKNMHRYRSNYPSGWALSPSFGGSTSSVEFEALTGLSMSFMNEGSVPYQQLLVKMKTFPSIVSLLKSRGYDATAIHPFDGTFYNRNRVYSTLGFDRFISQDEMSYKDRLSKDGFISDMSAVKQAFDVLNTGDQPHFIHLVTMQNHFPIQEGMNGPNTIKVSGLQADGQTEMESYAQNVKESDQAVQYLVEAIHSIKRPTILLVFGDHLPALKDETYRQAVEMMSAGQQQLFMHETPLLIAANYPLLQKNLGTLSPSFFGPLMFQLAGLQQPSFYQLLETVKQQLPGVSSNVYVDKNGMPFINLEEDQKKLLHDYELVQYDLLYGKGYTRSMMYEHKE